jgi:large subunit ribosomal protein L29
MKAADLREKSVEDLTELQKSLVHDAFQNRLKNFTNRLDDTSAIRKSRRDLARVITILHQRASAAAPAAAAVPEAKASKPAKAEAKTASAHEDAAAEAKPKKTAAKKPAKKSEAK